MPETDLWWETMMLSGAPSKVLIQFLSIVSAVWHPVLYNTVCERPCYRIFRHMLCIFLIVLVLSQISGQRLHQAASTSLPTGQLCEFWSHLHWEWLSHVRPLEVNNAVFTGLYISSQGKKIESIILLRNPLETFIEKKVIYFSVLFIRREKQRLYPHRGNYLN